MFASWHWYLDRSNGASITTRETLLALARRGWDVKTFRGAATDFFTPPSVDEILTSSGAIVKKRFDGGVGENAFRAVSYRDSGVESVVVAPRSGSGSAARLHWVSRRSVLLLRYNQNDVA